MQIANCQRLIRTLDYLSNESSSTLFWQPTDKEEIANIISSLNSALSCGAPQASVLGPHLFLLYINDLNQAITFCKVHHFADDTNILSLSNSIKKLNKLVNDGLKHLVNWLNANKISLKVKKN